MEHVEGSSAARKPITVRHCSTLEEYEECVRLQLITWGEDLVVPSGLFVVARETGGQTLGAFAGEQMVGFTLGLAGFHKGKPIIHSHMTAVLPDFRDRGIGRMLKLAQRNDCLARGIRLVEWTFDPLELKNAHFNINRLGAVVRRYLPNCYGITQSPLHAGLPTDRLMAEWRLDSPRVQAILRGETPKISSDAVRISVPQDISSRKQQDPEAGARVQAEMRQQFLNYLEKEFVLTNLEIGPREANYVLEPMQQVASQLGEIN
ncbi:MAG TPA: GNAT family N-acetyltransferase [Candidatus Acidoferrales bacterium]|nr:GNAT family N-acetyltransferase [Candidatus Acidoferrales bacterium]